MLLALLACTHTPPTLYPTPVPRVDLGELPPASGPAPVVLDIGDPAPAVGLLVSAEDWAMVKTRSRLLTLSTDALRVCYDGREADRAHGQAYADQASQALHEGQRREQGLRLAAPLAFIGGGLIGAGLAVGVAWGLPR